MAEVTELNDIHVEVNACWNTEKERCSVTEEQDSDTSGSSDDEESWKPHRKFKDHSVDIHELSETIDTGEPQIRFLAEKDVVLIIGSTGVGKSSFIQLMNGVVMKKVATGRYEPLDRKDDKYLKEFTVGHGQASTTKHIRAYTSATGLVFCDLPGFKDTHSNIIDISTSVWIKKIAGVCKSIRLIFMVPMSMLRIVRGGMFNLEMQQFANLLKEGPENYQNSMYFIFTHKENTLSEEAALKEAVKSLKGLKKESSHEGARSMIDVIIQHIKRVTKERQPLDSNLVRILSPTDTNISDMVHCINHTVVPLPKDTVRCSLTNEAAMAVGLAYNKLQQTVRDALFSVLPEKQNKLIGLIQSCTLLSELVSEDKNETKNKLSSIVQEVHTEHSKCKQQLLTLLNYTVRDSQVVTAVGEQEIHKFIRDYHKFERLHAALDHCLSLIHI